MTDLVIKGATLNIQSYAGLAFSVSFTLVDASGNPITLTGAQGASMLVPTNGVGSNITFTTANGKLVLNNNTATYNFLATDVPTAGSYNYDLILAPGGVEQVWLTGVWVFKQTITTPSLA